MTEGLEDKGPALPWGWLFHSQFFIRVVYFGRPSLVNTETRKYPKINKEVVIANRSSFVFPRISLTQARSCRPKRSKTSRGCVRGDGHPSTGGRQDGGPCWEAGRGLLASAPPALAPPALRNRRHACPHKPVEIPSWGLTPAAPEARGDERPTAVPPRFLCPILSWKGRASHSRVQPGVFLPPRLLLFPIIFVWKRTAL